MPWRFSSLISILVVTLVVLSLAGCSVMPEHQAPDAQLLERAQLGLGPESNPIAKPLELDPNDDVLYLNEASKQALFAAVNPNWRSTHKYQALLKWLRHGHQTILLYRNDYTRTAMQTIRHGVGNCLSLTAVFYAYAKALDLNVHFNHVQVPPTWQGYENQGMFLVYDHINAKVKLPFSNDEYVDFSAEQFHPSMPMTVISELAFKALFYGNRSIEYMVQGDTLLAFRYGLLAVKLDPNNSNLWNNLATQYRRLGHRDLAKTAYQQAIVLQPDNIVAWSNLAFLYRRMGNIEKAQEIDQLAEPHRNKNPFYLAWLAQSAAKKGQTHLAIRSLKRAIDIKSNVHYFYDQLAILQTEQGDYRAALANYHKAYRHTDKPAYRQHYAQKQAELTQRLKNSTTSHRL